MSRDDIIELVGIACIFAAPLVISYGLFMVAPWLSLIAAGVFLLVLGIGCAWLANRGSE